MLKFIQLYYTLIFIILTRHVSKSDKVSRLYKAWLQLSVLTYTNDWPVFSKKKPEISQYPPEANLRTQSRHYEQLVGALMFVQ